MYGRFETDAYSFLLLELATGGDLLTRVQQAGGANESTARDWLRQLVAGVAHLHARAVAHRDLKLENVLVGADGRLKITDFGLSREVGEDLARTFCGSKEYLPPEMLAGQPYDALKADVGALALGVISFIIVANHMPFADRGGVNAIINNQRARAYRYPVARRLSANCTQFIDDLMTFDWRQRSGIGAVAASGWLQG